MKRLACVIGIGVALLAGARADDLLPWSVGPDQRQLVDAAGAPVLVNGDTAWSMMVGWTREETLSYLDNRKGKGFNALIVNLIERAYAGDANTNSAPLNRYGHNPFLTPGDFSTPHSNYFNHAEWVVSNAAARGLVLFMTPCYLGYPGSGEGWYNEVLANGAASCLGYGQYLGQRFAKYSNIVWMAGGDRNPDDARDEMESMVAGLRQYDSNNLWTAHNLPEWAPREVYPTSAWLDVDNVYTYNETWPPLQETYAADPVRPFFFLEGHYEYVPGGSLGQPGWYTTSERQQRSQAYWTLLCGGMGHFMGNFPIWHAGNNWSNAMDAALSRGMVAWSRLARSRAWHQLRPDTNHLLVTAGYGSGWDYTAAAQTEDGRAALAYIPDADAFTIDLTRMTGTQVRAWWFNPRTGLASNAGLFATTGSVVFTPPSTGDWVFAAEDAALNLPPPGVQSNEALLVDFGLHVSQTASPDANGRYWNNLSTDGLGAIPTSWTGLLDTAGQTTAVRLSVSGFGIGANTNGTLTPAHTLGALAINQATRDSLFANTGTVASVTLTGLVASALYQLECFASRDTTDLRITRYTVLGAATNSATLQVSGSGIGAQPLTNANAGSLATLTDVQPTAAGALTIRISTEFGAFSYIGALRLVRTGTAEASSTNTTPVALSVMVFGAPRAGSVSTGSYQYTDADLDAEGATLFQWERAVTNSGPGAAISGATSISYQAAAADIGQYLRLLVTPAAVTGVTPGTTVASAWRGPVAASHALAVFHIGNSFTRWGDVPAQVAGLAASSNRPHARGDQLADGQNLGYQWTNGLPGGVLTRGSPSRSELATATWDALVLQPMSREWQSANLAAFQAHAGSFDDLADAAGTRVFLYAYWPYRDEPLSDQDGINAAFEQVRAALSTNGPEVLIIPAGEAFRQAANEMGSGELAGLSRTNLYRDELHPSDIGYYLSALVHFAVLHRRSPVGLPAVGINSDSVNDDPVAIPTNVAAAFQRIAWDVARSFPHTGVTVGRFDEWFAAAGLPGSGEPEDVPHGDGIANLARWAFGLGAAEGADPDRLPRISLAPDGRIEIRYGVGIDAMDAGVAYRHEWSADLLQWTRTSPSGLDSQLAGDERVLRYPSARTAEVFRAVLELP